MKVCIVLIEYITSLNDDNLRNNASFLEWLKRDVFDEDLTPMLRYTLNRVFDLFYRQDRFSSIKVDFWSVEIVSLYGGLASDLVATLSDDVDHRHARALNVLMMRTFETLALTRTDKVTLLQSIFWTGAMDMRMESMDDLRSSGKCVFTRLAKIYCHALGNVHLLQYDEHDYCDMYKAMKAFDWRPLSDVNFEFQELPADCSISTAKTFIASVPAKEEGSEGYYQLECTQTAAPWEWMIDIMELDFESMGKALRSIRASVNSGKTPRSILKCVDKMKPSGLEVSLQNLSLAV